MGTESAQHLDHPCSVLRHLTAGLVGVRAGVRLPSERLRRYQTTTASIEGNVANVLAASCMLKGIGLGSLVP